MGGGKEKRKARKVGRKVTRSIRIWGQIPFLKKAAREKTKRNEIRIQGRGRGRKRKTAGRGFKWG